MEERPSGASSSETPTPASAYSTASTSPHLLPKSLVDDLDDLDDIDLPSDFDENIYASQLPSSPGGPGDQTGEDISDISRERSLEERDDRSFYRPEYEVPSAPLDDDTVASQRLDSDVENHVEDHQQNGMFLRTASPSLLANDNAAKNVELQVASPEIHHHRKKPSSIPTTPSKSVSTNLDYTDISGGMLASTPSRKHRKSTDFTQTPKRARIDHYFKPVSRTPSLTKSTSEELERMPLVKPPPKVVEVPDDLIDLTNEEIVAYDEQYAKILAEQERRERERERERKATLMRNDEEYARRLQFAKGLQDTFEDDDDIQFVGIREGTTPSTSTGGNTQVKPSRPVLPKNERLVSDKFLVSRQNNIPSSSSLTIGSSSPTNQRYSWSNHSNGTNSISMTRQENVTTELSDKKALRVEMRKSLEKCSRLSKDLTGLADVKQSYIQNLDASVKRSSNEDQSSASYWQSVSATNILKSNISAVEREIELKERQLKEERRLVTNYTMALSSNDIDNPPQSDKKVPSFDDDVIAIGERRRENHFFESDPFNEFEGSDQMNHYYSDDSMESYDTYSRPTELTSAFATGGLTGFLGAMGAMRSKTDIYYENLQKTKFGQIFPSSSSNREMPWTSDYNGVDHYGAYVRRTKEQEAADLAKLLDNIKPDEEKPESRIGTPDELLINLMEHQKIGLKWLQEMEANTKGGLLADDMGLGKTIQIIALLVSRASTDEECKTTLIVTPVSLCRQWAREIAVKVKKQFELSVYVYHGQARRNMTFAELSKYDVVLTSYGVLSRDFKEHKALAIEHTGSSNNNNNNNKKKEQESVFFSHEWYRIVLDEAQYIKNRETLASKACSELRSKLRWCLSGTPMQNNVEELYSLVRFLRIRPYNELKNFTRDISNPVKSKSERARQSGIDKVQAILKAILLRRTKSSKIDGKPILILPPKSCEMIHCVFSEEERTFYRALEHGAAVQFNRFMAQGTDFHNVLVLLLRLRQACCHPRLIQQSTIKNAMEAAEEENQDAEDLAKKFNEPVVSRIKEKEAFECPVCWDAIEELDIRLIFPCGHECCAECIGRLAEQHRQYGIQAGYDNSDNGLRCPTCRGVLDPRRLVTWAAFQKTYGPTIAAKEESELVEEAIESSQGAASKLGIKGESTSTNELSEKAKGKMVAKSEGEMIDQDHKELLQKAGKDKGGILGEEYIGSAKVNKCLEILKNIMNKHPGEKTLVFSSFTSLLDIIGVPLDDEGIRYVRYDGSMSAGARNDAIFSFQDEPDLAVMLISLKAGNVGLNLTSANHCILLDPFWNPYVEDQAVDRVHRIGQTRPVTVHRLVVPDTVEDRILKLQKEKREMIEAALDEEGMRKVSRLGRRELAFLLGINREV